MIDNGYWKDIIFLHGMGMECENGQTIEGDLRCKNSTYYLDVSNYS